MRSGTLRGAFDWLLRPGLARRIAVAMVLSLVAVQLQAFLQLRLLSKGEIRLVGTRWFAQTIVEHYRSVFALPAGERAAYLRARDLDGAISLTWQPAPPAAAQDDATLAATRSLTATVKALLGDANPALQVGELRLMYHFPMPGVSVSVAPAPMPLTRPASPIGPDEPDLLLPPGASLSLQGPDGSWLTATHVALVDQGLLSSMPGLPLLGGGIIIAIFSLLTARRIVAPLESLIVAADRIGTSREYVPVSRSGLGEYAAVARAFEDMQRRLLRFVDDRTQMLAAISHDLRSSLMRLRLAAEVCKDEDARRAFSSEIQDMSAMVESTLAFASGEAQMSPDRLVDVAALLISLSDNATDFGFSCHYTGPDHAQLLGHPVSLKRAFGNLIDNAVKYGQRARIVLEQDTDSLGIVIEDDGPGIAPEQVEEAFAPFRRLDPARSGAQPGAGLGLTIARDVIHSHGGRIELGRAASGGLRVSVRLPIGQLGSPA